MSRYIDRFFAIIKWPVALIALWYTPSLLQALWKTLLSLFGSLNRLQSYAFFETAEPLYPFVASFLVYLILWWLLLRRPSLGYWFSTLEHELTHALFALLTFHRVVSLRATWKSGGEVRFVGKGNWLIAIAPYFFPTLSFLVMLIFSFLGSKYLFWASALLGVTSAYHITSTWRQTHAGQSDLRRVGFLFSFCFLPASNFLVYGCIFRFTQKGFSGFSFFLRETQAFMQKQIEFFSSYL